MNNIAMMTMIARKEVQKEMDKYKFVMDGFNRDGVMFCCDNATVTMDTDLGEVTTGVKDLKFYDMNTCIKDRFEDYVRKDELEGLINEISSVSAMSSKDHVGDALRMLSTRLSKGNKKKNEFSFLNYEKEIRGYEVL